MSHARNVQISLPLDGSASISFDDFYQLYPRKKAPRAAERAWNKAIKRAPAAQIMAGLRAQLDAGEFSPDPELRKYPATWLNFDCWADEITGRRAASSHARVGDAAHWKPLEEKPWIPFVVPFHGSASDFYSQCRARLSAYKFHTWIGPSEIYGREEQLSNGLKLWLPNEYFADFWYQNLDEILGSREKSA